MLTRELDRNNPASCVKRHVLRDNLAVGSGAAELEVDKAPLVGPRVVDDTAVAGPDDAYFDIRDSDYVLDWLHPRAFGRTARRHHVGVVIALTAIQGVEVIQLSLTLKENRTFRVALLPRWNLERLAF